MRAIGACGVFAAAAEVEVVFVTFMIVVIFGLFNIITAIFVDSTTTGLKHNDISVTGRHCLSRKSQLLLMRLRLCLRGGQSLRISREQWPGGARESGVKRQVDLI